MRTLQKVRLWCICLAFMSAEPTKVGGLNGVSVSSYTMYLSDFSMYLGMLCNCSRLALGSSSLSGGKVD